MTIEYTMQMKVAGEWKHARVPTGQPYRRNTTDISIVKADIERYKVEWRKNWNHNPEVPTDFRIVSRMVSDWQPVE
jgi:hypothetical protein